MTNERVYKMAFSKIYPLLVQNGRKGVPNQRLMK